MNKSLILTFIAFVIAAPHLANAQAAQPGSIYAVHNLVSDLPSTADSNDPNLVNAWGIAASATGPFWVSDNRTGVSTLYNGSGQAVPATKPLAVRIPPPQGGTGSSRPTGIVFNPTTSFVIAPGIPALFLFATEDGTISGWNPQVDPANAVITVDNSSSLAVYKGMAIGSNNQGDFLFVANFRNRSIDVYNTNFYPASLPGTFSDPGIPVDFAPFNIQNIGGKLYVTYAQQDATRRFDVRGPGNGFVNVFDTSGRILQRLVVNDSLNSPWGLALAPASFGDFGGLLLVGNFGDGKIHGFDPVTGVSHGALQAATGDLVVPGLWALMFGNGGQGGDKNLLFFTAGIPGPGKVQDHGLLGSIQLVLTASQ